MAGEHMRLLTADDRPLVEQFRCVEFPRRWEQVVPELVDLVAMGLDRGISAIGAFEHGDLVGMVAWRPVPDEPSTWSVPLLGVRIGYQRQGIGRRLKVAVLDAARTAGIAFVVSRVHCDNTAMLDINIGLGAHLIEEPPTDWYGSYFSCIITV